MTEEAILDELQCAIVRLKAERNAWRNTCIILCYRFGKEPPSEPVIHITHNLIQEGEVNSNETRG